MNSIRLTRREGLFATGAIVLVACTSGETLKGQERFVDMKLQNYGKELASWELMDGRRMIDLYPDVQRTVELLSDQVDPRQYLPIAKVPIRFVEGQENMLNLNLPYSDKDPRQLIITLPGGEKRLEPWLDPESDTLIMLDRPVINNTIRRAIFVKEISQIYDHIEYCRLYLSTVQKEGIKFEFAIPKEIPTSEEEKIFVAAHILSKLEQAISRKPSFLVDIVDYGSGIRVGGILYGTWYVDQLNRRLSIPEHESWALAGNNWAGFLQHKDLILQKSGRMIWKNGKKPLIDESELLPLVQELTRRQGPQFITTPLG